MTIGSPGSIPTLATTSGRVQGHFRQFSMMTVRLDQQDSYRTNFQATVTSVQPEGGQSSIILDATCFYPTSGGQPSDRGTIDGVPVVGVEEEDGVVVHLIEGQAPFTEGQVIQGDVDWRRRFDHMQQHTGQHILSQAFLQTAGFETESFHIGGSVSTIDLSTAQLEPDFIYSAENLSNQIIFENREIRTRTVAANRADTLDLRRRPDHEGELRTVEIDDFDQTACGGTHCRRTGEVGLIKVRRWTRVRKRARVEFYCGSRALLDYREKNRSIYLISKLLSQAEEELAGAVEELLEKQKAAQKKIENLKAEIAEFEGKLLESRFQPVGAVQFLSHIWDLKAPKELGSVARGLANGGNSRMILLGTRQPAPRLCLARSEDLVQHDLRRLTPELSNSLDGRGGGSPSFIQVGGRRPEGLEESADFIKGWLAGRGSSP